MKDMILRFADGTPVVKPLYNTDKIVSISHGFASGKRNETTPVIIVNTTTGKYIFKSSNGIYELYEGRGDDIEMISSIENIIPLNWFLAVEKQKEVGLLDVEEREIYYFIKVLTIYILHYTKEIKLLSKNFCKEVLNRRKIKELENEKAFFMLAFDDLCFRYDASYSDDADIRKAHQEVGVISTGVFNIERFKGLFIA